MHIQINCFPPGQLAIIHHDLTHFSVLGYASQIKIDQENP